MKCIWEILDKYQIQGSFSTAPRYAFFLTVIIAVSTVCAWSETISRHLDELEGRYIFLHHDVNEQVDLETTFADIEQVRIKLRGSFYVGSAHRWNNPQDTIVLGGKVVVSLSDPEDGSWGISTELFETSGPFSVEKELKWVGSGKPWLLLLDGRVTVEAWVDLGSLNLSYVADEDDWPKAQIYEAQLIVEGERGTASFSIITSEGWGGNISPIGTFTKMHGDDQQFTATPYFGYEVDKWYLDGEEVQEGGLTYTIVGIQANHVVLVVFHGPETRGRTIYVDDDGPANFNTIQEGINGAIDGDTIIVKDGYYAGPMNRDIDFKGKALTLRSENGPSNCVIDCEGAYSIHHRGFYFHNNEDANSILEGFTITNGWAQQFGGAIFCENSSPTIAYCVITGNNSLQDGGAITLDRSNSVIMGCRIIGNKAFLGAVVQVNEGDPIIDRCVIEENNIGGFGTLSFVGGWSIHIQRYLIVLLAVIIMFMGARFAEYILDIIAN